MVYRNLDLVSPFQPLEDSIQFGLDALFVFSDVGFPPASAPIRRFEVNRATGTLTFHGEATDGVLQLEKASDVLGPWLPIGPITQGSSF